MFVASMYIRAFNTMPVYANGLNDVSHLPTTFHTGGRGDSTMVSVYVGVPMIRASPRLVALTVHTLPTCF